MTSWVRCGALVCALAAGCSLRDGGALNSGVAPTPATMNFPIAVALSRAPEGVAPEYLFVVNSNFDLRFNHATLMAIDLEMLDTSLPGCTRDAPCIFEPLDQPPDPEELDAGARPLLANEVAIGSHADGIAVSPNGGRIYMPVRSDRNLTFVDFNAGTFDCGSVESTGTGIPICGEAYRAGNDAVASARDLTLQGDPVAVVAGAIEDIEDIDGGSDSGDFVLMALREGRVALFLDQQPPPPGTPLGAPVVPQLVHIVEGLSPSLVAMTLQPGTGVAWLTSAVDPALDRVAIALDPVNRPRSFLFDFGAVPLIGLDDGSDTRDIQFHPDRPESEAFVLSRRPEAVVSLDLDEPADAAIEAIYEVGNGPSRIAFARIGGRLYALASCFDARRIFVIDVEHGALVSTLGGFSGPFEIVVDPVRRMLFAADFSTSVVRVVDLSPLANGESPYVIATLGEPTPVESFVQ